MASSTINPNPLPMVTVALYAPTIDSNTPAVSIGSDVALTYDISAFRWLKVSFLRSKNTGASYRGYVFVPVVNGAVDINTWDVYLGGKDYGGTVKLSASGTAINIAETSFSSLYLYRVIGVR